MARVGTMAMAMPMAMPMPMAKVGSATSGVCGARGGLGGRGHGGRARVGVQGGSGFASGEEEDKGEAGATEPSVTPPGSFEDAVRQARRCLVGLLEGPASAGGSAGGSGVDASSESVEALLRGGGGSGAGRAGRRRGGAAPRRPKGLGGAGLSGGSRSGLGGRRYSVEAPLAGTGAREEVDFAAKVLLGWTGTENDLEEARVPRGLAGVHVLTCGAEAEREARKRLPAGATFGQLASAAVPRGTALAVVVSPSTEADARAVAGLDAALGPAHMLVVNPGWDAEAKAGPVADAVRVLDPVYYFSPLAIQSLFWSRSDGAVLRARTSDDGDHRFLTFVRKGDAWRQVGSTGRRPDQDALEATLYNASASEGVGAKVGQAFRGVFDQSAKKRNP